MIGDRNGDVAPAPTDVKGLGDDELIAHLLGKDAPLAARLPPDGSALSSATIPDLSAEAAVHNRPVTREAMPDLPITELTQSTMLASPGQPSSALTTAAAPKAWPTPVWKLPPWARKSPVGCVELLSTEWAMGWAAASPAGDGAHVVAVLGTEVIGSTKACFGRADLDRARAEGELNAYAFAIVFDRVVSPSDIGSIQIVTPFSAEPLPRANAWKTDRTPPLRIFVVGSPRSGTSEMGSTLTGALKLRWLGEGHAAPLFAAAADALQGNGEAPNGLVRFIAKERFRSIAVAAARQAYFFVHSSASFVDKTPGVPMIKAVPFLNECFPGAYFIFLWRNPVGNLLSRMAKFGGSFDANCRDWAAAMTSWADVRQSLPHFLEVRQEDMLLEPHTVAAKVAAYLGMPEAAAAIGESLSSGSRERTGAGIGKRYLNETGWTSEQIGIFSRICAPVYGAFDSSGC